MQTQTKNYSWRWDKKNGRSVVAMVRLDNVIVKLKHFPKHSTTREIKPWAEAEIKQLKLKDLLMP